MNPMKFHLKLHDRAGEGKPALITMSGSFDPKGVARFEQAQEEMISSGIDKMMVDVRELDHISSAGIGCLMDAMHHLRTRGGGLVLIHPSDQVMGILEQLNLKGVLPIAGTQDEAAGLLNKSLDP